jgi:hypothetical protein
LERDSAKTNVELLEHLWERHKSRLLAGEGPGVDGGSADAGGGASR